MPVNRTARASKRARRLSLTVVLSLVIIYLIMNTPALPRLGSSFTAYLLIPGMWVGVVALIRCLPAHRLPASARLRGMLKTLAFLFGCFAVAFSIAGGLLEKSFGKSPFLFTPKAIALNLILVSANLLGTEFARSYLIGSWAGKHPWVMIAVASLGFAFMGQPLRSLLSLKPGLEMAQQLGRFVLPAIAESFMASYLAYLGGPSSAIIYRASGLVFQWFCPVLPNPSLITAMFVGTLVPVFSLMIIQQLYAVESREIPRSSIKKESPLSWIVTSVFCIGIVWFAVGIFPIYPSVIATGSMEPMIDPGDVILVKKTPAEQVHIGDVVNFKQDKIDITHRVIGIEKDEKTGLVSFRTKGDNNPSADSQPVKPEQIKGIVINVVPKVGWPTLVLKSKAGQTNQNVQF